MNPLGSCEAGSAKVPMLAMNALSRCILLAFRALLLSQAGPRSDSVYTVLPTSDDQLRVQTPWDNLFFTRAGPRPTLRPDVRQNAGAVRSAVKACEPAGPGWDSVWARKPYRPMQTLNKNARLQQVLDSTIEPGFS